jgi:toxin-antitoxin system PIN domain toxin
VHYYLLDVNVPLTLIWSRHENQAEAQAWFRKAGHKARATNPLNQLGLLRLLTNSAVGRSSVNAVSALEVLEQATRNPGHPFWPPVKELPAMVRSLSGKVQGHRQWTDAVLLGRAAAREGALLTFDSGVRELGSRELGAHIHVLRT